MKAEGVIKHAVLLSVIHDRLGDASPWHDLAPVVHQRVRAFHLPQVPKFFVGRAAGVVGGGRGVRRPLPPTPRCQRSCAGGGGGGRGGLCGVARSGLVMVRCEGGRG